VKSEYLRHVRLSAWNNRAPIGQIFIEFDIWAFFENLPRKFKFHKNVTRITGTLHGDLCTCMIISLWILLRMRNAPDESCRENQSTHFMFNNVFPKIVPFMRFVEKYGRAWEATDTRSEYIILIAFWRQQWLGERASLLHCMYIACLVIIDLPNPYFSFSGDQSSAEHNLGNTLRPVCEVRYLMFKFGAWCAVSATRVIWPLFFSDAENSEGCIAQILAHVFENLSFVEMVYELFQQVGVAALTVNNLVATIRSILGTK
jgi:hypothetical protein